MGLSSVESSLGRRASFSPYSGAARPKDIFLSAAFKMAENAGVNITRQEANAYRDKRKPLPEEGGSTKSDPALFAEVLSGERGAKVEEAYRTISRPH